VAREVAIQSPQLVVARQAHGDRRPAGGQPRLNFRHVRRPLQQPSQ